MDEARVDNFIQITVVCPSEPQVAAFVYRNDGKVDKKVRYNLKFSTLPGK